MFAAEIRRERMVGMRSPRWRWHLDEVFVKVNGVQHYLWRAVYHDGEVLEAFVPKHRDKRTALKFLRKLIKRHGRPEELRSYEAALKEIGTEKRQVTGRWANNRVKKFYQPFRRRESAMQHFRRLRSLQKFVAVHASVHNFFNTERSLSSRPVYKTNRAAALAEWRGLCAY